MSCSTSTWTGAATRLCPDAPVPVVDVSTVRRRAGGAGLVARMLANDGHHVTLVTVLGADGPAGQLKDALSGITVVAGPSGAPTPVKTRVRAGRQPVVRFDEGCAAPAGARGVRGHAARARGGPAPSSSPITAGA